METLSYSTTIAAPRAQVWSDMLNADTYRQWAKAFSENSHYDGEWALGSYIKFIDPAMGGTKARIDEFAPPSRVHAVHVAIITKDGTEDTTSDFARKWIGVTETYTLSEVESGTELVVEMRIHSDYAKMFNDCWPKALEMLRGICERSGTQPN